MTIARSRQISLQDTPYYHVVCRRDGDEAEHAKWQRIYQDHLQQTT